MNNALLFSQIFGPLLILLGVSMIINKKWYAAIIKKMQKAHVSVFMFSIFGFVFGMYVLAHSSGFQNIYEGFTTIVAASIVLKSAFYLLTPNIMKKLSTHMGFVIQNIHFIGALYLFVGLYMTFISYV